MLRQIVDIVEEKKIEILVIAGDIYDRKVPPIDAITLFENFIDSIINKLNRKVLIISGNHDSFERLSFGRLFFKDSLYIFNEYNKGIDSVTIGDINFFGIPFEHYINFKVKFDNPDITSYNLAYKEIFKEFSLNKNDINVCISHGFFAYNKESFEVDDSVRKLSVGGNEIVDISLFSEFDVCCFGHLHKPSKMMNELHRYSGSPLKYSFSEVAHSKSVVVYDINSKNDISYELVEIIPKFDLVELSGYAEDLLKPEFYYKLNLQNLYKIHLEDTNISKYIDKIKKVYFNTAIITHNGFKVEAGKLTSQELRKLDTLSLFEDFYLKVNNKMPSENEVKILKKILEGEN